MSSISRQTLKLASAHFRPAFRRNLATSYFLAQAPTDPVQGLFLDKIRDYATKKAAAGGKLVDATPVNILIAYLTPFLPRGNLEQSLDYL